MKKSIKKKITVPVVFFKKFSLRIVALSSLFSMWFYQTAFAAPDISKYTGVFDDLGTTIVNLAKKFLQYVVLPVAIAFGVIFLAIQIAACYKMHREGRGDEMHGKIVAIVITFICLALLGTFAAWAWNLF